MPLTLEELVRLKNIIVWSKNNAYKEETINNLLESERVIDREINLKTTNYVTGERYLATESGIRK